MAFTVKRFKDYIYNELNRESRVRHMNDRAIQFEDAEGRKIKISPDEGIQVEDSEGTIIHDTPDCIIAADMIYGGHLYFKPISASIGNISQVFSGTPTFWNETSSVSNIDLSGSLPADLTNPTAVSLYVKTWLDIDGDKTTPSAAIEVWGKYSLSYNPATAENEFYHYRIYARASTGTTADLISDYHTFHAPLPIVWSGTTPYISWQQKVVCGNMTTIDGDADAKTMLMIQGFYA